MYRTKIDITSIKAEKKNDQVIWKSRHVIAAPNISMETLKDRKAWKKYSIDSKRSQMPAQTIPEKNSITIIEDG